MRLGTAARDRTGTLSTDLAQQVKRERPEDKLNEPSVLFACVKPDTRTERTEYMLLLF